MAKYSIDIPKPCSEDWNQMTPLEKGRHCAVCEKTILDFSSYTKGELIQYIKQEGKICGRVPANYIQTNLIEESEKKGIGLHGIIAATINLLVLTSTTAVQGQNAVPTEQGIKDDATKDSLQERKKDNKLERLIAGRVTDVDNIPLPGTAIYVRALDLTTRTDVNGNFQLELPADYQKVVKIEFQFIGMEMTEIKVKDSTKFQQVVLKESKDVLGDIVIKRKRKWLFF